MKMDMEGLLTLRYTIDVFLRKCLCLKIEKQF